MANLNTFHDAQRAAESLTATIEQTANYLARLMKKATGHEYRVQLDYEQGLAFVVARMEKRPIAPKRGELV